MDKDKHITLYPYVYKIDWWDDYDEQEKKEFGLLFAPDYYEAIYILGHWYGEKYINKIEMEVLEDGPIPIHGDAAYELLRREKIIT